MEDLKAAVPPQEGPHTCTQTQSVLPHALPPLVGPPPDRILQINTTGMNLKVWIILTSLRQGIMMDEHRGHPILFGTTVARWQRARGTIPVPVLMLALVVTRAWGSRCGPIPRDHPRVLGM
jgi:hypothetical protein